MLESIDRLESVCFAVGEFFQDFTNPTDPYRMPQPRMIAQQQKAVAMAEMKKKQER